MIAILQLTRWAPWPRPVFNTSLVYLL